MKYRLLSFEELEALTPEFVNFLSAHGIAGEDWAAIKAKDAARTAEFLELFSDMVLEKALQNIQFLEFRLPSELKLFQCGAEEIDLIGISVSEQSFDFLKNNLSDLAKTPSDQIKILRTSKKYSQPRESEIFAMLGWGCTIAERGVFELLEGL